MSLRNIRLILAYDGTDFSGWQIQKNARTVQGDLQAALDRMHGHPVKVKAAGRTDAGVHASGQTANFFSDLDSIPPERFTDAINSYLPRDIRVTASAVVDDRFHARRSARLRVYRYYIHNSTVELPYYRRYSLQVKRRLSLQALNAMASVIVGEHDFTSFAAAGDANKRKTRRVVSSCLYPERPFLVYKIAADSFLWKMVRIIVGTMLGLSAEGGGRDELISILQSRDRGAARRTAPARGLFLERVLYDEQPHVL